MADVKLLNPKTCARCRAWHSNEGGCALGYKTEVYEGAYWAKITSYEDAYVKLRPAEPCPKPMTISEMANILSAFRENNIDVWRHFRPKPYTIVEIDGVKYMEEEPPPRHNNTKRE